MTSEHKWPTPRPKKRYSPYPKMSSLRIIYKRDKGICHICKKHVPYSEATRDHVVPVSHGGSYWPKNLKLAHEKCNKDRGTDFIPIEEEANEPHSRT